MPPRPEMIVGTDKIAIQPPSCPSPIQMAFGWDVDGRFQPVENPIRAVEGWELYSPMFVDSIGSRG